MSTAGIFDEEECALTAPSQGDNRKTHSRSDSEVHKYSALWQVTWERIDCFLPNLRQELFTPRSQSLPINTPPVKVEQEKVLTEQSNPGSDRTCPVDEGKKLLFCQLRTFAPIATAHRCCARKFTRHVMHRVCALRNEINNDRENGHCYSFAWI